MFYIKSFFCIKNMVSQLCTQDFLYCAAYSCPLDVNVRSQFPHKISANMELEAKFGTASVRVLTPHKHTAYKFVTIMPNLVSLK